VALLEWFLQNANFWPVGTVMQSGKYVILRVR